MKRMRYEKVKEALFLERPNRFIARIFIDGKEEKAHVKNTGRCRELLLPGESKVYVVDHGNQTGRKTRYSLIGVEKGCQLVNMDSQAPNQVVREWLEAGNFGRLSQIVPEKTFGQSRIDFYYEREDGDKGFLEVKGVTLEEAGIARFPDAPTERGIKHLEELIHAKEAGYEAAVFFVIQMAGIRYFEPNDSGHPAFGEALRKAAAAGVELLAYSCKVGPDSLEIAGSVPVRL